MVDSSIEFPGFSSEAKVNPIILNGRVHGYQMEVDPSKRGLDGGIYDEGRRLWLYSMEFNDPGKKGLRTGNGISTGSNASVLHIRTWVNGIPTAWLIDDLTPKRIHCIAGAFHPKN